MIQLTFLGTAAGIPDPDRNCSCTMLEIGENVYLIDAGAPVLNCLRQKEMTPLSIRAIFTTHHHSDHTAGLLHLLSAATWFYREATFDVFLTQRPLIDAFTQTIRAMDQLEFADRLHLRVAEEGTLYDDGILKATYIPVRHCDPFPSYAILIEAEGKRLLFTGDLSRNLEGSDFPAVAHEIDTDLIVCEMAHFSEEHIAPYLAKCKTKHVLFNHHQPHKAEDIRRLAAPGRFPFTVTRAYDGEILNF